MYFYTVMHLEWNRGQHRVKSMTVLTQVLHTKKYKISYSENKGNKGQKGGNGFGNGWHNNSSWGHSHGHGRVMREMLKDIVCKEFKTKGKYYYGTRCW